MKEADSVSPRGFPWSWQMKRFAGQNCIGDSSTIQNSVSYLEISL
jgi:hypothetical protein